MIPTCPRCGRQHYNFTKCVDHPEAQEEAARRKPHIVRQPLPEGVRVWGDKLHTLGRIGENRLMNKETSRVEGGRVIYPDGEGPKAA
jgi:hypothetical protein